MITGQIEILRIFVPCFRMFQNPYLSQSFGDNRFHGSIHPSEERSEIQLCNVLLHVLLLLLLCPFLQSYLNVPAIQTHIITTSIVIETISKHTLILI